MTNAIATTGQQLVQVPVPGTPIQIAATENSGDTWVSLRHVCEAVGIDYSTQLQKLKGKSWANVGVIPTLDSAGRQFEMIMINRKTFTMWLATIDENKVSKAAKPTIVAFQAEAADALDAYFHKGAAINPRAGVGRIDAIRLMLDQIEATELAAAEARRVADEAKALATETDARLGAMEGRHDYYSALGYARLNGIENTSSQFLNKVGRQAAMIARSRGVEPAQAPHALYGKVNTLPAWVWEIAFEGREK